MLYEKLLAMPCISSSFQSDREVATALKLKLLEPDPLDQLEFDEFPIKQMNLDGFDGEVGFATFFM